MEGYQLDTNGITKIREGLKTLNSLDRVKIPESSPLIPTEFGIFTNGERCWWDETATPPAWVADDTDVQVIYDFSGADVSSTTSLSLCIHLCGDWRLVGGSSHDHCTCMIKTGSENPDGDTGSYDADHVYGFNFVGLLLESDASVLEIHNPDAWAWDGATRVHIRYNVNSVQWEVVYSQCPTVLG